MKLFDAQKTELKKSVITETPAGSLGSKEGDLLPAGEYQLEVTNSIKSAKLDEPADFNLHFYWLK